MSRKTPYPWEYTGATLTVETPEQVSLELRIAPYGSRMVAALLDYLILFGSTFVLLILVVLAAGAGGQDPRLLALFFAGLYLVLDLGYFTLMELRGHGRTVGKRAMKLRTVGPTGQGLTFGGAVLRNLARFVDILPITWFVPLMTGGQKRIGDIVAGTYVVLEEGDGQPDRAGEDWLTELAPSYRELQDRVFPIPLEAQKKLKKADLDLLEYLEEELDGAGRRDRTRLLREMSRRYAKRLGLEDQREEITRSPERFLQELGLLLRDKFDGSVF